MFASDLEAIDKLRTEAINVLEPHSSGIKKLMAYAAQLVWISGKFPIDVSGIWEVCHDQGSPITSDFGLRLE